jgi:hypothetical protein
MGVKISNLPAIVTPALTDVFPVVQAGVTYKETFTQLSALLGTIGVTTITGTPNQVIASASTGPVTLSLPQSIATTSDVTFGSVAFSPTTKGIVGTTTNDNASAGYVGEYKTATAAGVALTTATAKSVVTLPLTAGDWDVWGNMYFVPAGGTTMTALACGISETTDTLTANLSLNSLQSTVNTTFSTGNGQYICTGMYRFSTAVNANIYIVAQASFGVSTMTATGIIGARRVR